MEKTKYLGIDYGEKRIGIAISDEEKKYAFSREYLNNDANIKDRLLKIIEDEKVSRIILGYPLNFKSEKTIQTHKVEEFKTNLEQFFKNKFINTEIIFFDERLTSKLAQSNLIQSGLKKKKRREKGLIDSLSAQIILQDYIDKVNKQI